MSDNSDPGPGAPSSGSSPISDARIPDHELVRLIARGSYGEVWLGRTTFGTWRAIKIVYERTFRNRRPFEREFNGVQKFEPVSRLHEGLMDVLQVGRNEAAGYFYCVMELADDVHTGQQIDPNRYSPRTLTHDINLHKRLPIAECRRIGAAVAGALEFLHRRGLIHRDVKPSNIVFVNGAPKLADIGLVAEMSEARSYVGTEGFIPPEGPGTAQADIYSLGKVLYEISTGKDRHDYPELPTHLGDPVQEDELFEFNKIVLKACRADPQQRYRLAGEVAADIFALDGSGRMNGEVWAGRRRLALIGGLAAAGLALIGNLWLSKRAEKLQPDVLHATGRSSAKTNAVRESVAGPGPRGLVSHWRAENSAADEMARNHGIVAGSNGVSYGPGVFGQAFVFDGTHRDRIDLGNPPSLQLEDFTIDAWIRRLDATRISLDDGGDDNSTAGEGGAILSYGAGGYVLALTDNGRLLFGRTDMDGVFSTNVVADTNWHHVAVAKSGTNVALYVDGTAEVTSNYNHFSHYTFKTSIAIGSRGDAAGSTFLGMVDELSVYNYALTLEEIQALDRKAQLKRVRLAGLRVPGGPVSCWDAEGDSADLIGSNDGKEHGRVKYAVGVAGRAFDFDGNENWIEVPDHSSLNPTKAITVECWLNRRGQVGNYDPVIRKVGVGTNVPAAGYTLEFLGNDILFVICNGTSFASGRTPLEFRQWYHVTGVYDGTNVLCYVNGRPAGDPVPVAGAMISSSNPLRIGSEPSDPTRLYDGLLDEVSIYDRALSAAEIRDHYQAHAAAEKSVIAKQIRP